MKKQTYLSTLFLCGYCFLLSIITDNQGVLNNKKMDTHSSFLLDCIAILIFTCICLVLASVSIDNRYKNYLLSANDEGIMKTSRSSSVTTILYSDINYIIRMYNGDMYLNTLNQMRLIIPACLIDMDILEQLLKEKNVVFITSSKSVFQKHPLLTWRLVLACLITILFLTNHVAILILGLLLIGFFLLQLIKGITRLKSLDISPGKRFFLLYIILIAFIIYIVITKLMEPIKTLS